MLKLWLNMQRTGPWFLVKINLPLNCYIENGKKIHVKIEAYWYRMVKTSSCETGSLFDK